MSFPPRLVIAVLASALLYSLSSAKQETASDKTLLLDLPEGKNIREVTIEGTLAKFEIADLVKPNDGVNPYELFDETFTLHAGSIAVNSSKPATGVPVEASSTKPETGVAEASATKGSVDWRNWISDTMGGPAHVSFSADGDRFVTVVHHDHHVGASNVTVWNTKPKLEAGPMRSIHGLIHAAISRDGSQVFLHTSKGLLVHNADKFGAAEPKHSLSLMGEPHTLFHYVKSEGKQVADFFFLVKQLVVELYPATLKQLPNGKWPPLKPIAKMDTNDYAVSTHYEPASKLMLVVEENRARLMHVTEKESKFLAQHALPTGVEFRSCKSLEWDTHKDYHTAAWAVGARRNVTKPTRDKNGTAEFGTFVLAYHRDATGDHLEILAEPRWVTSERWNLYSPRAEYSDDASQLVVYTRDKAWTVEVPR